MNPLASENQVSRALREITANFTVIASCMHTIAHCVNNLKDADNAAGTGIYSGLTKRKLNEVLDYARNGSRSVSDVVAANSKLSSKEFSRTANLVAGTFLDLMFASMQIKESCIDGFSILANELASRFFETSLPPVPFDFETFLTANEWQTADKVKFKLSGNTITLDGDNVKLALKGERKALQLKRPDSNIKAIYMLEMFGFQTLKIIE
jgi:hypothetical protein